MDRVLKALVSNGPRATGKLYAELFPGAEITRNDFENVLGSAVRSGLISQTEEIFEKDGKRIPYRTVRLVSQARLPGANGMSDFLIKDASPQLSVRGKKRKRTAGTKRARAKQVAQVSGQAKPGASSSSARAGELEKALKLWRLNEAKRRSVPAFRIFTDRVLKSMLADTPQSANQLSAISGVSTNFVKQYGAQICAVIRQHAS